MPKRKNPFGDSTPIQLKTHVGFNQAATEADKQVVYERTKALLFLGSNPQMKSVPGNMENVPPHCNGLSERLFDDIGTVTGATNGHMISPSSHVVASTQQQGILKYFGNRADSKASGSRSVACVSCNREGVELVMVCIQCGRQVCGVEGCLRECSVCQQVLCQFCTVLNYDERAVRTFCFDCLPTIT